MRSGSTPSSVSARSRFPGATTTTSARCAHVRSRAAQAAPCGQVAPVSIASSMSSSVPCRCATIGTPGAATAAAAFSGVR
jgi:hypothetical protein